MKNTGIVRRIDELGRIVLPMELRRIMGIEEKDPIEIYTEGNNIILCKHQTGCAFCGETEDITVIGGQALCKSCIEKYAKEALAK